LWIGFFEELLAYGNKRVDYKINSRDPFFILNVDILGQWGERTSNFTYNIETYPECK
jgi:hypothetical protein